MKTKRLLLVLSTLIGVVFTARWWLPALLKVLSVNGDLIQALDSSISLTSNLFTAISALGGYLLLRDQQNDNRNETLEQRNRRILLNHVENAWIKGVLDASLYGAALLDLGIKETPEAITNKYPWAIKKESTDETLPSGTSMLEIFDFIGMGRSLLILGAPGSGKTTMLLELTRGLIARAREDVTQPIPMVFNLSSWTEKLSLADWLAQELNNLYSVPRKTAPDWVRGNKLLLLLDGLDEVRQDNRAKCVEAINEFRKQNGLTSLAVCSRSQDYADLKAKLSFEGAIEVQPLTQGQIAKFFDRFGDEMAGIKKALERDNVLWEMAETPLFLSIILMAYRDKQTIEILTSGNEKKSRKHLMDIYIERMFERYSENTAFEKKDALRWLSWLAIKMVEHNQVPYILENTQPEWLDDIKQKLYKRMVWLGVGLTLGLTFGLTLGSFFVPIFGPFEGLYLGFSYISVLSLTILWSLPDRDKISTTDSLTWNLNKVRDFLSGSINSIITAYVGVLIIGVMVILGLLAVFSFGLRVLPFIALFVLIGLLLSGLGVQQVDQVAYPGQRLSLTKNNFLFTFLLFGLSFGLSSGLNFGLSGGLNFGLSGGLFFGQIYGGFALFQHYALRFILTHKNLLPWRLVPFLDHCVDLIFLRRVGGGYIFIHRLLMEHFAEMYVEEKN